MKEKQTVKKEKAAEKYPTANAKKVEAIPNVLPETGLVRVAQILGDRKKGIVPIVPVSRSNWWAGVRSGRYPKGIKLSDRITVWRAEDIRTLIGKAV